MILVTGAAGKTGQSILSALARQAVPARALVRSQKQADEFPFTGKVEVVIGDLRNSSALEKALEGVTTVYFICPNMASDELEIGKNLLSLAKKHKVTRIVYHSVLHPQVEAMPHHWQKMRMEEEIFISGLDFTILQPCAYMQNVLQYWNSIINDGIFAIPYATSAKISMVDLEDVGQVAASVLTENNHSGAIYELAGPQPLSQEEVVEIMAGCLERPVIARKLDRDLWSERAKKSGMDDYQHNTLVKMFEYYENYGLTGNPNVLEMLLQRPPNLFKDFITRHIQAVNSSR